MAEVSGTGFAYLPARRGRTFRPGSAALLLVFGLSSLIAPVTASAQSAVSSQAKKATPGTKPPAAEPARPTPPTQIWLPPLQAPAHVPVIAWDGKLLTIDAYNSSLSEVLLAIRSQTGAWIEMPASTNTERVAVHLGPAPIREVLSSLLYGTDFNYVIQSSEDDQGTVEKVIVTSQDAAQDTDDAVEDDTHTNPRIHLKPGYSAPGKRDFEVPGARAMAESSSAVADPSVPDSSAPSLETAATPADSGGPNSQTESQPAKTATDVADPSSSTDGTTSTTTDPAVSGATASAAGNDSGGSSNGGETPTISQREQNLQKIYQQRQQLQAQQQGRGGQTPTQ